MPDIVLGTVLIVVGCGVMACAAQISAFERRLLERHPWTKVTGWSGTRKGVLVWRIIGAAFVMLGFLVQFDRLVHGT